jgi:hypothetical protein
MQLQLRHGSLNDSIRVDRSSGVAPHEPEREVVKAIRWTEACRPPCNSLKLNQSLPTKHGLAWLTRLVPPVRVSAWQFAEVAHSSAVAPIARTPASAHRLHTIHSFPAAESRNWCGAPVNHMADSDDEDTIGGLTISDARAHTAAASSSSSAHLLLMSPLDESLVAEQREVKTSEKEVTRERLRIRFKALDQSVDRRTNDQLAYDDRQGERLQLNVT